MSRTTDENVIIICSWSQQMCYDLQPIAYRTLIGTSGFQGIRLLCSSEQTSVSLCVCVRFCVITCKLPKNNAVLDSILKATRCHATSLWGKSRHDKVIPARTPQSVLVDRDGRWGGCLGNDGQCSESDRSDVMFWLGTVDHFEKTTK